MQGNSWAGLQWGMNGWLSMAGAEPGPTHIELPENGCFLDKIDGGM